MTVYTVNSEDINFIGCGKILINTDVFPWHIPELHFLLYKNSIHLEAICLEFGFVAYGLKPKEAIDSLCEYIDNYIRTVMTEGGGFEELLEVVSDNSYMADYWDVYRKMMFLLARGKEDLGNKRDLIKIKEQPRKSVSNNEKRPVFANWEAYV